MSTKKRFNATFRKRIAESGDKQFLHLQVGRAYENEDGNIDLIINSIPINWDGKLRLWLNKDELVTDEEDVED